MSSCFLAYFILTFAEWGFIRIYIYIYIYIFFCEFCLFFVLATMFFFFLNHFDIHHA